MASDQGTPAGRLTEPFPLPESVHCVRCGIPIEPPGLGRWMLCEGCKAQALHEVEQLQQRGEIQPLDRTERRMG